MDEFLKARAAEGVAQAEVAERIGTTQSAVARLESGRGKHLPGGGVMKRNSIFTGLAAIIAVLSLLAATGFGSGEGARLTADGALRQLVEGNARYAGNDPARKDLGSARRTELTM
jgi:transcriptional regulator with XRE-family HTH domain